MCLCGPLQVQFHDKTRFQVHMGRYAFQEEGWR